jgi:LacI family transcriptional regulator
MSRRPTIDDVARLAGVSMKTVSRVFNREPNVRVATREKVLAAAETLDYRPNLSARQLASKQTFMIGMLYDNPNADYVTAVQAGSLQACREFGYHLLISPCRADSPDLVSEVNGLRRQVDGLIVLQPLSDLQSLNRLLLDEEIPCVRVSQRPFAGLSRVSVADIDSADEMTEHLLELGHRRIGFIVGHPDHGQSHDRLAGYRRALARHEIEFDERLVEQGLFDYESGCSCTRRLLNLKRKPTAIFASNDAMAMGVLSTAHEMGFEVPRQLSVAGFDDSPLARHGWPPLTTVRQPIGEVARLATEELVRRLQGRSTDETDHCLKAELVFRASTARPVLRAANL